MTLRQFYDWQTLDGGADVSALVQSLERLEIPWCMIGGLAVNHWAAEPMATADVDLVIATGRIEEALTALRDAGFREERHEWSVNFKGSSNVSIKISTENFYQDFPARSVPADVHGILMRVASLDDTLQGKIAACSDPSRRPSKRQKDLADIARLLEAHPALADKIPPAILSRLEH